MDNIKIEIGAGAGLEMTGGIAIPMEDPHLTRVEKKLDEVLMLLKRINLRLLVIK